VPEPADLTHAVLLRVAEFLRRLPPDQIAALADGTAKLEIAGRGSRAVRPAARAPVPADQVRAELARIGDRAAAKRWLVDQNFKVDQLRALARELDVAVARGARKDDLLDAIVQARVGRRLDFEAVSRPAPAPTSPTRSRF
jgi:hypothetical protein